MGNGIDQTSAPDLSLFEGFGLGGLAANSDLKWVFKVRIANRADISVTNAERTCVAPAGLQDAINAEVAKVKNGRSFVRASGTEDVVRVYAEAETQAEADQLAVTVCQLVYKMANGQGECPTSV